MTMEQTSISFDKACIFGAGAIGGWMGAALARAGCQLYQGYLFSKALSVEVLDSFLRTSQA